MAFLNIERVNALPDSLAPDTMYFVASNDGLHFDLVVTGNTADSVGHVVNTADVGAMIVDTVIPSAITTA
ncbi:MAG: hypothetical protein ACR2HF_15620 [Methylococcaceae bacterium]